MNPYLKYITDLARLESEARELPLGGFPSATAVDLPAEAPRALVFSPHPDDECLVGGLALRLLREARYKVLNVAVTLGGNPARRAARLDELKGACQFLDFGLILPAPLGLERVDAHTRSHNFAFWRDHVEAVAKILALRQPRIIFLPHEADWHPTHVGTHHLVMDALQQLPEQFECYVLETEFWGGMTLPNLLVETTVQDVADLVAAASFHVGEMQRNPYHLRLPAWLQDNVRRGAELVGGAGQPAPAFGFGTLYRLRRWKGRSFHPVLPEGQFLAASESPELLIS